MTRHIKKPMPVPSQTWIPVVSNQQLLLPYSREEWLSYLPDELLVDFGVTLRAIESLLEECEQDRNDDDCLESLAEDNQEYWHGKYFDCHHPRTLEVQRYR